MVMERAAQFFILLVGEVCRETLYINRHYWDTWHPGCDGMWSSGIPFHVQHVVTLFLVSRNGLGRASCFFGQGVMVGQGVIFVSVFITVGQGVVFVSVCMGGRTRRAFTARPGRPLEARLVLGVRRLHAALGGIDAAAAAAAASPGAADGAPRAVAA